MQCAVLARIELSGVYWRAVPLVCRRFGGFGARMTRVRTWCRARESRLLPDWEDGVQLKDAEDAWFGAAMPPDKPLFPDLGGTSSVGASYEAVTADVFAITAPFLEADMFGWQFLAQKAEWRMFQSFSSSPCTPHK